MQAALILRDAQSNVSSYVFVVAFCPLYCLPEAVIFRVLSVNRWRVLFMSRYQLKGSSNSNDIAQICHARRMQDLLCSPLYLRLS